MDNQLFDDYTDLSRECINLNAICGTWESVSLHPSLIIYKDGAVYKISVIHIAESGQASPSTYEIQIEETYSFIIRNQQRMDIYFDPVRDVLSISYMGKYQRN